MTVTVNGTTGVSLVQDGVVVQADLAAGVVGSGPVFTATFAGLGTSNGFLLLQPAVEFDPTNAYSAGVFTPQVAGYYQVSASYQVSATTVTYAALQLKKNATTVSTVVGAGYSTSFGSSGISAVIYLNGTTDSISLYQDISVTGSATIVGCRFGAFLARAA